MSESEQSNELTPSQEETQEYRSWRHRLRESYDIFLSTLPSRTVLALRWIVSLTAIVFLFEIAQSIFTETEKRSLETKEIVTAVRSAATNAAERVTRLRDLIAGQYAIRTQLAQGQHASLFLSLIAEKKQFDDSLAAFLPKEPAPGADEQFTVALYDENRKLTAWSSTTPLRAPWDSVLTDLKFIENKSRAIYVLRDGEYVWLIALRRMSDTSSMGYVISRALLAYAPGERHANQQSFNFIDPIASEIERTLDIDYSLKPKPIVTAEEPYAIIAEQGEPATFIGMLRIGDETAHRETGILKIVIALRELLTGVLVYFLLGAIIYVLLKRPDLYDDPRIRLQICEVVIALFVVARVLVMVLGNFAILLPESVHDTDIFGIADLAGIAGNPIELFLTTASVAACIAVIARIVSASHGPQQITVPFWKFTLYFLIFIVIQVGLIYLFRTTLTGIITNSTVSPYPIRQAIPDLPQLCVYFSIVSLGFIYCVAAAGTLIWFLTSSLPMMRLDNYEILVGRGVVLVIVLLFFTAAALSLFAPSPGSLLATNYWLIVTLSILAITAIVWLAQLKNDSTKTTWKFSLTSGLSMLVLVSGGSLVVAPLVASLEFDNQATIVELSSRRTEERVLEDAAKLESAFMQTDQSDTNISDFAYSYWKKHLQDDNIISVVLVTDGKKIYAEYGQPQLQIVENELVAYADSLARQSRRLRQPYLIKSNSADSLPLSVFDENSVVGVQLLDSMRSGLFLAVLVTPSTGREPQVLFRTASSIGQKNGSVVRSVFIDNTLRETSDPSLNIPSHLPHESYMQVLRSDQPLRVKLPIDQDEYLFVLHRSPVGATAVLSSALRVPGLSEVFAIALYIHFLGILLAVIFAIVNFIFRAFFTSQQQVFIRFRERILLIVIVLAFIPLVLVTNVTRSLLAERELSEQREQLAIDANAAVSRLRDHASTRTDSLGLASALRQAASTLHRSVQLYTMDGLLRIANDEKLVQTGFISSALDLGAVMELLVNGKTFAFEDVRVGNVAVVRSAFQVLPSASGRPVGILAIREIDSATSQEADVAATISFIYGIFAAIAVLLLLIGALFAYLVSRPIAKVIQATEQVAGGAYGVVVPIDRKDEMGDLANAFNRMSLELDKSRERLAQSEREVAWKEMARQVAHEIKNPLTPMKLSVQHVEHAYETKDENFETIFRRVMRTLSEQINVLTRIASEFARFGEMPRRKYAFVSLKKVIESAIALFDADRGRIRFVTEIPENLSSIYADEEEFRRTLVNLIRNAVQAIDKWGVIIVSASERHGIIHLKITDTGSGINKETLARIFDPNFSTKTSGMGLGLAIVKRSITDMSGQISVESEVGKGTTFHIELPAREPLHI